MLVKKKNPEWFPSENKALKVGETIEITDPKALITSGQVVAIDEKGIELSAFDLYGVITKDERQEFEEYKKMKQQEALKQKFEEEAAVLKAQLEASKKEEKKEDKVEEPKKK